MDELSKNWVENSFVVYIGQAGGNGSAATLRKRLKTIPRLWEREIGWALWRKIDLANTTSP